MKKKVMMTLKTTSFPWEGLDLPRDQKKCLVRLVANDVNPEERRIFWARTWNGRPALLVECPNAHRKSTKVPKFKKLAVTDCEDESGSFLLIELLDLEMQSFFHKVCLDIISKLQRVSEQAFRRVCLLRLDLWSSFLRPSRSRMSFEQQKGLIAELLFLKRNAFAIFSVDDALDAWTGPEAAHKDFSFGQTFVEVKSKGGAASSSITISSERQLSINPTEDLFLFVVELNPAPDGAKDALSISDVVQGVSDVLESPIQQVIFETKLARAGFFDEDEYSDMKWTEGATSYYCVTDNFPKIDLRSCVPGVEGVSYRVNLNFCEQFKIERAVLLETVGASNV